MIEGESTNAFEEHDPVTKIFVNPEIERLETMIKSLKAIGLYRTAEINQRKLDRLLQEEETTLEG